MASTVQVRPDGEEHNLPLYSSFILRCWIGRGGQVRARLIEVRSGVSHPVIDLDELPELLYRLITNTASNEPHIDDVQARDYGREE